jgi:thiamine biosynthesis lipoprotein
MDPRSGGPAAACASVTVIAPSAMVADALATAAFVLGPAEGRRLLERHGVEGLIVTPALERFATRGTGHE